MQLSKMQLVINDRVRADVAVLDGINQKRIAALDALDQAKSQSEMMRVENDLGVIYDAIVSAAIDLLESITGQVA